MVVIVAVYIIHILRLQHLDAEACSLLAQLVGELRALDTFGEAWHVVQALGGCGLAAQRGALDHQRGDALARSVKRRGQPSRPAANHDQIVVAALGGHLQAQFGSQRGIGGFHQESAIGELDGRDDAFAAVFRQYVGFAGLVLPDIHPTVGGLVLAQELLAATAVGAPVCAIDGDVGLGHFSTFTPRQNAM